MAEYEYYVPDVVITFEALAEMTAEVMLHSSIETSWQMAGFITGNRHLIVTNVIRPGYQDVVRNYGTTVVGGSFNNGCYQWLVDEFAKTNARYPGMYKPEMAYGYCFAGHSHHYLGVRGYSMQDYDSILSAVMNDGLPVALGPLANIRRLFNGGWVLRPTFGANTVIKQESEIEWKFYYLSQEMVQAGQHSPILVKPSFVKQASLRFRVPVLGWRFADPARFERDVSLLTAHGCKVAVYNRDLPEHDHMVVQFFLTKEGWKSPVVVDTVWNYPYGNKPTFTVLLDGKKAKLPERLRPGVDQMHDVWQVGDNIVDSIVRIEEAGVI